MLCRNPYQRVRDGNGSFMMQYHSAVRCIGEWSSSLISYCSHPHPYSQGGIIPPPSDEPEEEPEEVDDDVAAMLAGVSTLSPPHFVHFHHSFI